MPHRRCGDAVLLPGHSTGRHLRLQGKGAALWLALDERPAAEEEISSWFDSGAEARAVLGELQRLGLIRPDSNPAQSPAAGRHRPPPLPGGGAALRRALLTGLPGTAGAPPLRLDAAAAEHLLGTLHRHGIVPLGLAAVEAGEIVMPSRALRALEDENALVQGRSLQIETGALAASASLAAAGIDSWVIKGLATAHLDYPHPWWRQMVDVDLLVPSEALAEAVDALQDAGGKPPRPYRITAITKAVAVTLPDGVEVDVHRIPGRLPYGGFARQPGALAAASVELPLPGSTLRALAPPDRFLVAVVHFATSPQRMRRLSSLRDALALWPSESEVSEWEEAIERWRAHALVGRVVAALAALDISPPTLGAIDTRPQWFERSLVRTGEPGILSESVGPLTATRLRHWPEAVRAMAFPDDDLLEASGHTGRFARLTSAIRRLAAEARRVSP